MPDHKRKLNLFFAFATLLLLAAAVGCRGFFVNPTLTGLTVGPTTPSVQQGNTLQMTATGTYDDGSTKTLTGNVLWSTDNSTIATVNTSGLLSAVSPGTATITATSGTVTGSTTAMITIANLVSITITPTAPSITVGNTQQFMAMGTVQGGGTMDVTNFVTWASSNTQVATIDNTGLASTFIAGTTQITASSGTVTSPAVTLTVN